MHQGIIGALNEQDVGNPEEYKLLSAKFFRDKSIPKYDECNNKNYMYLKVSEQGIQFRLKPKEISFVQNTQLFKAYQFQEIHQVVGKMDAKNKIYASAISHKDSAFHKDQSFIAIVKFQKQNDMKEFNQKVDHSLKQQRKIQQSQFTYLPIQQNIRQVVEKCILKSQSKWFVFAKFNSKIQAKKIEPQLYRQIIMALIGNESEMKMVIRKQKIQAYEIQKKQYIQKLKEEKNGLTTQKMKNTNQNNVNGKNNKHNSESEKQLEGYTNKRQMEGIVKLYKPQLQLSSRFQEQLCLDNIPNYTDYQIHELLSQGNGKMDIQINNNHESSKKEHKSHCQRLQIPKTNKSYSIFMKQEIKEERKTVKLKDNDETKTQRAIEAVKFMYKLMEIYHKEINRDYRQTIGELVKTCKQIITDMKKDSDFGNNYVTDFMEQATHNYMQHRGKKLKIYD